MTTIEKNAQDLSRDLDRLLARTIHDGEPGASLAVNQGGRTLYCGSRGIARLESGESLTEHSSFDGGSIAKMVTGLAIALLEEEGQIDLGESVASILPNLPPWGRQIRIRHLLHHESGLHSYFTLLYYMTGWHEHAPPTSDEIYETLCRISSLTFEPGSRYAYSDSNYFLLARIVEHLTGECFGDFARRTILEPLNMEDSYCTDCPGPRGHSSVEGYVRYPIRKASPYEFRSYSADGGFHPTGLRYRHVGAEGLRTSVTDLVKLGTQFLFPTLLPPTLLSDRVLRAQRTRSDGFGYGYGINVGSHHGQPFVGHNGAIQGYTGSLSVFPSQDLIIASLTNRSDLGAWTLREAVLEGLGLVRQADPSDDAPLQVDVRHRPATGLFLSPKTAHFARIDGSESQATVRLNGSSPCDVAWTVDPAIREHQVGLWLGDLRVEMEAVSEGSDRDLSPYEGAYSCAELDCTYWVQESAKGIRLRNANPEHPSMDLEYAPTLPDFFWSHDPHPGVSQIQFLREGNSLSGFIYRDYDGDGRESFVFQRKGVATRTTA